MDSIYANVAAAVSLAAFFTIVVLSPRRHAAAMLALAGALLLPAVGQAGVFGAFATAADPCTITWDGGAGTLRWHDAQNWDADRLPGAGDHVCIPADAPGRSVLYVDPVATTVASIQSGKLLNPVGGRLTVTGDSSVAELVVAGGVFEPAGLEVAGPMIQGGGDVNGSRTINVAGGFTWSGGSQGGNGALFVDGAAGITIEGDATRTIRGPWLVSAEADLRWTGDAELVLESGGGIQTIKTLRYTGDSGRVTGAGTLHVGEQILVDGAFRIDSKLDAVSATARVDGAGHQLAIGTPGDVWMDFKVLNGGSVYFDGPAKKVIGTVDAAVGGGVIASGDVSFDHPFTAGFSQVNDGTVTLKAGTKLGRTRIAGGIVELGGNTEATSVEQSRGEIRGAGVFSVTDGEYTWKGGTQSGPGTTTLANRLHLEGEGTRTLGRSLAASSGIDWDGGELAIAAGAELTADATSAIAADAKLTGAGRFALKGILNIEDAELTAEARFETAAGNASVVVSGEGGLDLKGASTQLGWITLADDVSSLSLWAGAQVFAAGSHVNGDGFVQVADTADATFRGALTPRVLTLVGGKSRFETNAQITRTAIRSEVTIAPNASIAATDRAELLSGTVTLEAATSRLESPSVKLGQDGTLRGIGVVKGGVDNAGYVRPDGVLKIEGDYTQRPGGFLQVNFVESPAAPRLDVTGTAALGNGLLELRLPAGTVSERTLIQAGSVSGQFDPSTTTACAEIAYEATRVALVPRPCVTFAGPGEVSEGAGRATFTISLVPASSRVVTVSYETEAGSATAGSDFTATSGTATFAPGTTSRTVDVPIIDDETQEEDERFSLRLTGATNADLVGVEPKFALIHDDDGGPGADRKYKPIAMGSLGIRTEPQAMNHRSVVGITTLSEWPQIDRQLAFGFRFDTGQLSDIAPMGTAYDINEAGDVVGNTDQIPDGDHDYKPVVRKNGPVWIDIPNPAGYRNSYVRGINNLGWVTGEAQGGGGTFDAVLWKPDGSTQVLAGGSGTSIAWDVNDKGQAIGYTQNARREAWFWDNGVRRDIPGLFTYNNPHRLNEKGIVVGSSGDIGGTGHAWVWSSSVGTVDLGPGAAMDINEKNEIVGYNENGRATLWTPDGEEIELNTLLPPGSGWSLAIATAINDDGAIAGWGSHLGAREAFVLKPLDCEVCVAEIKTEHLAYSNSTWTETDKTVDGNEVKITAKVKNEGFEPEDVVATIVDQQTGEQLGEDIESFSLQPDQSKTITVDWNTKGSAWKNGQPRRERTIKVVLRDPDDAPLDDDVKTLKIAPRPVVLVHGVWRDSSTWAAYAGFLHDENPDWVGQAASLSGTSIAQNAQQLSEQIDAVRRAQEAWHVDLVAHSSGGLVARYYVHSLMQTLEDGPAVAHLVMLGTPNWGTPCAWLAPLPELFELRPEYVAAFNGAVSERRGTAFSVAAGAIVPGTCQAPLPGDGVVPLPSAVTGYSDTQTFLMLNDELARSQQVFDGFVAPRLTGASGGTAALRSLTSAAADGGPELGDASPQLATTDSVTIAAGREESVWVDTTDSTAVGALLVAPGTVSAKLRDSDGAEKAALAQDASIGGLGFRTLRSDGADGDEWELAIRNNGTQPVTVPVSVWVEGSTARLTAFARQANASGAIRVDAQVTGRTGEGSASADLIRAGAAPVHVALYDDGLHGDQGAGDGVYSNKTAALPDGDYVARVSAGVGGWSRVTTAAAQVKVNPNPPPNSAPVPTTTSLAVQSEAYLDFNLQATDADDDDLTYRVVSAPDKGTLTGTPPALRYRSPNGYVGAASFRYTVSDGKATSAPQTVAIDVKKRSVYMTETTENETHEGSTLRVQGQIVDALRSDPVQNAPVDIAVDGQKIDAGTNNGNYIGLYTVPAGNTTLHVVVRFLGTALYAPAELAFDVPVRSNRAPVVDAKPWWGGEAGYATRFFEGSSDADGNLAKIEWDWQDDGVYDVADDLADGHDLAYEYVYPSAFSGKARVRVTDSLGLTAEDTIDVVIKPHRPLGRLQRVTTSTGTRINVPSLAHTVSEDGRFVLFDHPRNDTGPSGQPDQLWVLDRQTGQDERVDILPSGQPVPGLVLLSTARISATGRYVIFTVPSGLNSTLYLRDRATKTTEVVSVSTSGQAANAGSTPIEITPDGRYVVFHSRSTNLDPRTAQGCSGCENLFVRDREAHTTELASLTSDNKAAGNSSYLNGGISADGRYVVFGSSQRAVPDKTTSFADLFVRDLVADTTVRVTGPAAGGEANGSSEVALISDRGRFVIFSSDAANLVAGDTNAKSDVFRLDRDKDGNGVYDEPGATAIERVSVPNGGGESNNYSSFPRTNCDGSLVAFWSGATNLVDGDTNEATDSFVRNLRAGTTTRVSVDPRDGNQADDDSGWPALSADGREVFFTSEAANLVPGDTNGLRDFFVYDRGESVECWHGGGTPANTAPVAQPVAAATDEATAVDIELKATDADGDVVSYSVVTQPAHGTLTGTGATRTYKPELAFHGTDTFTYRANDGKADSAPATVTITVRKVDQAPVALPDTYPVDEDATLVTLVPGVLANDTDADGDLLRAVPAVPAAHGTATLLEDGSFAYTPAPDFNGTDTFTYRATDGTRQSDPVTVTLTVKSVNDAPACAALALELDEDTLLERSLACTDVDGDALAYELVDGADHGELTLARDGALRYRPEAQWHGADAFTFRVSDGTATVEAEVSLTVRPVDDPAVLSPDSYATDEDHALEIGEDDGVLANDGDPDTELAATVVTGPAHGTLALDADGSFRYVPAAQFHGADGFRYAAGGAQADVAITVRSVNDGPHCEDVALTTAEDTAGTVRIACGDVDGAGLTVTLGSAGHGSVANEGLNVTYTPAANYHGADEVGFTVRDAGGKQASGTIEVTVTPVNDEPAARDDSAATDEDATLTVPAATLAGNDTDADGDELHVASVGNPEHGTVELAEGTVRFVPAADFHGAAGFRYTVADGHGGSAQAEVRVTVRSVNDRPTADDVAKATDEDTAVAVELAGADVDGDELAFRIVDAPAHGTLAGTGAARTYTPDANWNGADTFTVVARDGALDSAPATVRVTVRPVNDLPVAKPDEAAMDEDEAVRIDGARLLANDTDVDGDRLRISAVEPTDATHGELTLVDGDVRYAPAANWNGTATFRATVSDGNGGEDAATVTVTVRPVNDAPTVSLAAAGPVDEGGAKAALRATAADVDGDELRYTWDTDAGNLTGTGASVELSADDGPKAAHVTVRVSDGTRTVEDRQTVEIRNVAPTAAAGPAVTGAWGVPLSFDGSVTDPSQADRAAGLQPTWQFGGGGTAAGTSVRHAFDAPGSYDAKLTATDKDGGTGTATAQATIGKRAAGLQLTATSGGFGLAIVSARLVDTVDPATAKLAGRTVVLRVDGKDVTVTTDADGRARLPLGTPLELGQHDVSAAFAEDALYLGAQADTQRVTVAMSNGKATGDLVLANGKTNFNPQANAKRAKGIFEWYPTGGAAFKAAEITAVGISTDLKSAWFAGTGKDGRTFVASVEKTVEAGKPDTITFRLWIAGTLVTGDGKVTTGTLELHRFEATGGDGSQG